MRSINSSLYFLLIALAGLLATEPAYAWGQLKDLNLPKGRGHIIYSVIEKKQVNYCIDIDVQTAAPGGFTYDSINIQTRAALNIWLAAIHEEVPSVKLNPVKCNDPNLNLMVDVSPDIEEPTVGNGHDIVDEGFRKYSHININTLHASNGVEELFISDFQTVIRKFNIMTPLLKLITELNNQHKSILDFSKDTGIPEKNIHYSTYPSLLHEMGHAFGLCDTHENFFYEHCDQRNSSSFLHDEQPHSLMWQADFFYLTQDDIDGLIALHKRIHKLIYKT